MGGGRGPCCLAAVWVVVATCHSVSWLVVWMLLLLAATTTTTSFPTTTTALTCSSTRQRHHQRNTNRILPSKTSYNDRVESIGAAAAFARPRSLLIHSQQQRLGILSKHKALSDPSFFPGKDDDEDDYFLTKENTNTEYKESEKEDFREDIPAMDRLAYLLEESEDYDILGSLDGDEDLAEWDDIHTDHERLIIEALAASSSYADNTDNDLGDYFLHFDNDECRMFDDSNTDEDDLDDYYTDNDLDTNDDSLQRRQERRVGTGLLELALLQGVVPVSASVGCDAMPGDFGFDPLDLATKDYFRITQAFLLRMFPKKKDEATNKLPLSSTTTSGGFEFSPRHATTTSSTSQRPRALILRDYREAEIRHGRLAMLAAVFWPLEEMLDQFVLDTETEFGPLLFGPPVTLPYFPLLMTAIMLLLGYLDIYSQAIKDRDSIGEAFLPGDCFWDPLRIVEGAPDRMQRNMQERELLVGWYFVATGRRARRGDRCDSF
jgi:hypothetical protein